MTELLFFFYKATDPRKLKWPVPSHVFKLPLPPQTMTSCAFTPSPPRMIFVVLLKSFLEGAVRALWPRGNSYEIRISFQDSELAVANPSRAN